MLKTTVFLLLFASLLEIIGATLPLSVRIGVILPKKKNKDGQLDNFLRASVDEINKREDLLNATRLNLQVEYADEESLYQTFHKACELFKYQVITVLGSNSKEMDKVLSSTYSNYHIPYLSTHPRTAFDGEPKKYFSLSLAPSIRQIYDPILALALKKGWKKVGIIYHAPSGTLDPGQLTEYFQSLEIEAHLYELRKSDIRAGLKDIQEQKVDGYVVDISENLIYYFLRQALESGIVQGDSTFIFTPLNILSLEKEFANIVKLTGASIIGLSPLDRETDKEPQSLDVERRLYSDALMVFAKSLGKLTSVSMPTQMSCQDPEGTFDSGSEMLQSMKNIEYKGKTGWISFDNTTNVRRDPLLYIYELESTGYMKKVGQWKNFRGNLFQGLTLYGNPNKLTQIDENNPHKESLRVGVIMKYGINSTEPLVNSYFDKLVFQYIAKGLVANRKDNLNVSLHYYHPKLHSDPHKSEERLAKFIKRKNLDLILGPFDSQDEEVYSPTNKAAAMELRVQSAVYTSHVPFLVSNISELTLVHKSEISLTTIISSSPFFWLNIIGLYLISSILLFGIVRLSPYSRRAFEKSTMASILGDCFWFLLPPGLPATANKIKAPSSRIFVLTYFIFTMEVFFIIAISFVVNLQGASQSSIIASSKGQSLPDEALKIENGLYSEGHYHIPEVEWRVVSRHFEPCLIQEKSLDELITYRAIFPKGSRWAANFSRVLDQLNTEGKLKTLQDKWFSTNQEEEKRLQGSSRCPSPDNAHINKHILWITLGIGYVLAALTALLEMCVFVFQASDSHNPDHYSRSELISTEFQKIFESKDSDIHHRVGESMERSPPTHQRFLTTM